MKIKIDDEIRVIKDESLKKPQLIGYKGRIIRLPVIYPSGTQSIFIAVEFKKHVNGSDCNGHGLRGFCWYMPLDSLKLMKPISQYENLKRLGYEI